MARAEEFLRDENQLTKDRMAAMNQARFEIARSAWRYDHALASSIVQGIHRIDSSFRPGGPGARIRVNSTYRVTYQLLGFERAEKISEQVRRLTGSHPACARTPGARGPEWRL